MTRRAAGNGGRRYVEIAAQYVDDVITGKQPACRWTIAACERQRRDLARVGDPSWPYVFDVAKAERVCRFIECLPHIKGPKAGELIRLEPWQVFVVTTIFGWLHGPGPREGKRRFRAAYLEVPRGNGKSALLSTVALYMTGPDGEGGAEVYSAATTRDQAGIVFQTARRMALRAPQLAATLDISVHAHAISHERSASSFKPVASDADSLEGLNIHFAAIDELHAHKTRDVYDVVLTGMGKRDQPLVFVITTAGSNRAGICYEVRGYILKVLQGIVTDETEFGVIYTIDDEDDWTDERAWAKANPNLGVSVDLPHIARLVSKAMQLPSQQASVKTKHLNVWVNADSAWLDMRRWDACADPTLQIEDFAGEPCVAALDLATTTDIAAKIRLFRRVIDDVTHYYAFGTYYLPSAAIDEGTNDQYAGWREQGLLIETPGNVSDTGRIEADLLEDAQTFRPLEVAYDPWQAHYLALRLQEQGVGVVEYRNTVPNFSAPMKKLEELVLQGRFHHSGDPVLAWMASNVVCHVDAKDNVYPRKEHAKNKIDGIVALIMAVGRCEASDALGVSFWETAASGKGAPNEAH